MKLFIDTANLDEIREINAWGILDGVTTNPTLIAKEGVDFEDRVNAICDLVDGPVSAEVVATDADGMVEEGRRLANIHDNVYVKCPITPAGLQATRRLSDDGIRVNVTLVFSANQALLAAKAGAAFVSPFIGRIDDNGADGMQLISDIVQIYANYGYPTEVLAASVRHPVHVYEAALAGSDIATCPHKVLKKLVGHPLTESGLERFLADWESVKKQEQTVAAR